MEYDSLWIWNIIRILWTFFGHETWFLQQFATCGVLPLIEVKGRGLLLIILNQQQWCKY